MIATNKTKNRKFSFDKLATLLLQIQPNKFKIVSKHKPLDCTGWSRNYGYSNEYQVKTRGGLSVRIVSKTPGYYGQQHIGEPLDVLEATFEGEKITIDNLSGYSHKKFARLYDKIDEHYLDFEERKKEEEDRKEEEKAKRKRSRALSKIEELLGGSK